MFIEIDGDFINLDYVTEIRTGLYQAHPFNPKYQVEIKTTQGTYVYYDSMKKCVALVKKIANHIPWTSVTPEIQQESGVGKELKG
jgi:hypothetical protein